MLKNRPLLLSVLLALPIGCGSSVGGCGVLLPLAPDPAPLGFAPSQLIEGGAQARISPAGVEKIAGRIRQLFASSFSSGFCTVGPTSVGVASLCDASDCDGGQQGCPAYLYLDSADRPGGDGEDGRDGVSVTVQDGGGDRPPVITVDATFDVLVPVHASTFFTGCYINAYDAHLTDDSADPAHVIANIELGIDAATGQLTMHLLPDDPLHIVGLDLTADGCGVFGPLLGLAASFVGDTLQSFIGDFIVGLIRPQLDGFLQTLIPAPAGLMGAFDFQPVLGRFHPPTDGQLDFALIAGGSAATSGGAMSLGVLAGVDSTPSACVPVQPRPQLDAAPWSLAGNPDRGDFTLPEVSELTATDASGGSVDVALGVSGALLSLAGFHAFNSGALCLHVGADALPQLNAGALAFLTGLTSPVLKDPLAPLSLSLRPQQPPQLSVGGGAAGDPLIHLALPDLDVDFLVGAPGQEVRAMTIRLDMNVGLDSSFTKGADGLPLVQPTLVGLNHDNVRVSVVDASPLDADPARLAAVLPLLIDAAASFLAGLLPSVALPSVAGFSLDGLAAHRVQTAQGDFVSVTGSIVGVDAQADALTRSQAQVRARAQLGAAEQGGVRLRLGADGASGRPVEYSVRVDGGMWRPWATSRRPLLVDPALRLPGRHAVDVRARTAGDWRTEQSSPVRLSVDLTARP